MDQYVDPPSINREEVLQIRKCFEYLQPVKGVVLLNTLDTQRYKSFVYMEEVLEELVQVREPVTFDVFFQVMKPKIAQLKMTQGNSVVLENTSTSVSCLFCPYPTNSHQRVRQ